MPLVKIGTTEDKKLNLVKVGRVEEEKPKESFPQMLGRNIPRAIDPLGTAESFEELRTERLAPIFHGLSAVGFGFPKAIIREISPDLEKTVFPEQTTDIGKVTRFVLEAAGMLRGGAATLAKAAGGKIIGNRLRNKVLRNTIEGATFGGTQVVDEPSLKGQTEQAALGAGFGVVGTIAAAPIIKSVKEFRKFKTPTKTPAIETVTKRTKEEGKVLLESIGIQKKESVKQIDDAIVEARKLGKEEKITQQILSKESIQKTTQTLKENVKRLDDSLNAESEETAKQVQQKLPEYYKANSRGYRKRLDDVSDTLIKKNEGITRIEVIGSLDNAVNSMDEALIIEGRPRQAIEFLRNKYGIQFTGQPSKFTSAASGSIISSADDIIPFKELVNDLKQVRKSLSAGAKSSNTRFTQEDVAVSILDHTLGDMIKTKVPDFAELQKAYAPIIQAMKVSNRMFKPFKGEFESGTAASMLKQFGLGKRTNEALIKTIEEGSEFAPGIGRITPALRQKGQQLIQAKQNIQPVLNEMRKGSFFEKVKLDKKLATQLDELAKRKEFIEGDFLVKEQMIKEQISNRLKTLGLTKEKIDNLMADKAKFQKLLRTMGITVGIASAGIGGFMSLKSLSGGGGR